MIHWHIDSLTGSLDTAGNDESGRVGAVRIVARLRGTCPDTYTCPTVYMTSRRTLVVQGYVVDPATGPRPGHAAVEVPLSLLPELVADELPELVRLTDRDTIVVAGRAVVDSDVLAQLRLPEGEAAVEIDLALVPELEGV